MENGKWKQRITIYSFFICIVATIIVFVIFPKESVSKSERRRLAEKPEFTAKSLLEESFMEDLEEYFLDHFPFRERLRRLKAYFAYGVLGQKENNGIYVKDGHAAKLEYPLNEDSVKRLANKMQELKAQYFPNENTWYAIVPDKNYFLAAPNGYPSMDYEQMLLLLQQKLGEEETEKEFQYIDIISGLSIEDYYNTDTHWKQERLFDTVERLGNALGIEAYLNLEAANYKFNEINDFYGVYYGQAALPMEADTISYLTSDTILAARVWNIEENMLNNTVIMPFDAKAVWKPIYQLDKLEGEMHFDKYDVFLGGAASIQVMESPDAATDRRLVIFRDSYTSSLAPLLLEGYSEIALVDLRYISSSMIGDYVDFDGADVLFLYNTSVVNQSNMLK